MKEGEDLARLVEQSQKWDLGAFQQLYEATYPRFAKLAFLLTGQEEAAGDVLQEAFLLCYRKLGTLSDASKFLPWMRSIVVRIATKSLRTRRRDPGLDHPDLLNSPHSLTSEDLLERQSTRQAVRQALVALPPPQLTALVLYYFEDLPIEQIAQAVGCRVGTVKSRLFYGKKKLEQLLQEPSPEDSFRRTIAIQEDRHGARPSLIRT